MSSINNIKAAITKAFEETDKDFVTTAYIFELAKEDVSFAALVKAVGQLGLRWQTMVVSGHGFLKEYQEKYNKEAVENIPQIYYGPKGFEGFEIGGGCAYVVCRK
jgi:hypothetical protein